MRAGLHLPPSLLNPQQGKQCLAFSKCPTNILLHNNKHVKSLSWAKFCTNHFTALTHLVISIVLWCRYHHHPILKIRKLRHREVKVIETVNGIAVIGIQAVWLLSSWLFFLGRVPVELKLRVRVGGSGSCVEKKSECSCTHLISNYKGASFHLCVCVCVSSKLAFWKTVFSCDLLRGRNPQDNYPPLSRVSAVDLQEKAMRPCLQHPYLFQDCLWWIKTLFF